MTELENARIRTARMEDLPVLAEIEAACFPAAEAASEAAIAHRLAVFPDCFWLLETEAGEIVSFVNGMASDEPLLRDEMYEDESLHREDGRWQMIFGVDTLPRYRRKGCAGRLLRWAIGQARARGRRGCVLTCKAPLVHYYESFGFVSEGVSASTHGGAVWYDMRLTF